MSSLSLPGPALNPLTTACASKQQRPFKIDNINSNRKQESILKVSDFSWCHCSYLALSF